MGVSPTRGGTTVLSQSLIPMVIDQTARGDRSFDIYSLLLKERIVFLGQEVDDQIANLLVAEILYLDAEDPDTRHRPLHQLARRHGLRRHGHLRRHPARPLRRLHHLRRHGDVGGGHDPGRGGDGQALRPAQLEDHDPPGHGRHPGGAERHGHPPEGGPGHHQADGRDHRLPLGPARRARRARHRPRLLHDPRRGQGLRAHRRDHRPHPWPVRAAGRLRSRRGATHRRGNGSSPVPAPDRPRPARRRPRRLRCEPASTSLTLRHVLGPADLQLRGPDGVRPTGPTHRPLARSARAGDGPSSTTIRRRRHHPPPTAPAAGSARGRRRLGLRAAEPR